MSVIADSSAAREEGRLYSQHQAALTVLQGRLGDPKLVSFAWLDLACGRGQLIASLGDNLDDGARAKIRYLGYDISANHVTETNKIASGLNLQAFSGKVGDLADLPRLVDGQFDFITFTNSVHEVQADQLASVLVECVARLSPNGCLFLYDMESLDPPELGAVPWTSAEVKAILVKIAEGLGTPNYEPQVGRWRHKSCNAWNAQVMRAHLDADLGTLMSRQATTIASTALLIRTLLGEKLRTARDALERLTLYGAETGEEGAARVRLLYEFWALSRAIGGAK